MDENRTNLDKKVGPHRNLFGRISNIRRLPISDKIPVGIPEADPRGLARHRPHGDLGFLKFVTIVDLPLKYRLLIDQFGQSGNHELGLARSLQDLDRSLTYGREFSRWGCGKKSCKFGHAMTKP